MLFPFKFFKRLWGYQVSGKSVRGGEEEEKRESGRERRRLTSGYCAVRMVRS